MRTSRKRALLTAGCAVAWSALALDARGAPLVYEPFDYADGTVLDGTSASGSNLAGSYAALGPAPQQKITATAPGLGYGLLQGAPPASGQRASDVLGVTPAGATVSLAQPVTVGPGEALYWSALFTLDDSLNGNHLANITLNDDATGDLLFFGEPGVGSGGLRVAASTQALGELQAEGADNAFTDGDTLLLVGRYLESDAPGGDLLQLLVYDTAEATLLPATFDPADPDAAAAFTLDGYDIDFAQITSITFTIRGLDNNFIDELRIGPSYRSVIPEPATASLLACGLAALAWAGRSAGRTRPYSSRPGVRES
jgi:hypothetical protein